MMTIEKKRRELFEASWRTRYGNRMYCESEWRGFSAALDAVVIDFPQKVEADQEVGEEYDEYAMGANCMRRHCVKAIESIGLGLKVKP